jgi:hypothetical protein
MIEVAFKGLTETVATLTNAQRQIPFAASQACNDTARDVQQWTINERLPEAFTLRSRGAPWWRPGTRMGFNITFARKTNLQAIIGSRAEWLKLQEEGGTKQRAGSLAIPTLEWKPKTEIMSRAKKPKRVLRSKVAGAKAFKAKRGGRLSPGIYVRDGDGGGLKKLFTFADSARINPVLNFVRDGAALAARVYDAHFEKRWVDAMRTRL